jgi:hypothetical protein
MNVSALRRVCTAAIAIAVLVPLSSPLRTSAGAVTSGSNGCARSTIDVPSCGVLFGLYRPTKKVSGQQPSAHYGEVETAIGRQLDLVKNYEEWAAGDTFPDSWDKTLAASGHTLYFSWNPVNYNSGAKITYASIANGQWDSSVIVPEANALKAFGGKVFLDFSHEFDAKWQDPNGTSAQFVAAYRHIHDVFANHGVTNVIWSWVTTGYLGNKDAIKAGYPGASYINWIGYDPYNLGSCAGHKWNSTLDTFKPFYDWVGQQPEMNGKPIMLAEYAAGNQLGVKAWYASLPVTLQQLPRIKALMQFSAPTRSGCNTLLTDSAGAMEGFKAAANSAYVTGR